MIMSQLLDLAEELSSSIVYCLHLTVHLGNLLLKEKFGLLVLHFKLNDLGGLFQFTCLFVVTFEIDVGYFKIRQLRFEFLKFLPVFSQ